MKMMGIQARYGKDSMNSLEKEDKAREQDIVV